MVFLKKVGLINDKCDNCGDCVKACGELHKLSRIGIFKHDDGQYIPIVCQHCASAPCKEVCPVSAISHLDDGTVYLDEDTCIGCGLCAIACPFGAIVMDNVAYKCMLCKDLEECACIKACSKRCLGIIDVNEQILNKRMKITKTFGKLIKNTHTTEKNVIDKVLIPAKVDNK